MKKYRPDYLWPRGSTLRVALRVASDPDALITGAETIRAVGKAVTNAQSLPPGDDAPEAFELTPLFDAETATWFLECSTLVGVGFYLIDARMVLSTGDVVQVAPVAIEVTERVTEPS